MAFYDQVTNKRGNSPGTTGIDFNRKADRKSAFAPVDTVGTYLRSPEYREWSDPEALVAGQGAQSIYQGARTDIRDASNLAQRLGLGRGYAAQARTNIGRNARNSVAEAMMSARLLGGERRNEGALMLADAIREAQGAALLRRMRHRANSTTSLFQGNMAANFGSGIGQTLGQAPGQFAGGILSAAT